MTTIHRRHTPMLAMSVHVDLSEIRPLHVDTVPGTIDLDPDTGRVRLAFGEPSGGADITLAASSRDLRHLSAMLDDAALELERLWAEHAVGEACDHSGGRSTRVAHGYLGDAPAGTVETLCDDCGGEIGAEVAAS